MYESCSPNPMNILKTRIYRGAIASPQGNSVATSQAQNPNRRRTRSQTRIESEAVSISIDSVDNKRSGPMVPEIDSGRSVRTNREPCDPNHHDSDDDDQLNPIEMSYRIRSRANAGTGSKPKRTRFVWGPTRERQQALYDLWLPRHKSLKKLWGSVLPVRSHLQTTCDQSPLDRASGALQVTGVIYAIYCYRTTRLYVGQTIKSASARFESHINASLRGDNEPFHRAIRRYGWRNFSCFPLEIIPKHQYVNYATAKARACAFRKHASHRELFWIERLHSYEPRGFNAQHRTRRRLGRKRVANPMKHSRVDKERRFSNGTGGVDIVRDGGRWFGSRDWLRRLLFLDRCITSNTLERINWDAYASRSLWGMLHYLEKVEPESISVENRELILSTIRHVVLVRPTPGTKRTKEGCDFIRIEWTSDLLRRIGLKSIILEPNVRNLLPSTLIDGVEDILIVKKLTTPIGVDILNFSSVARNLPKIRSGDECACRRLFDASFRPDGKCVRTGDVEIVKHVGLRQLIVYGPRFRERAKCDPLAAVRIGLDEYIRYHVRAKTCTRIQMAAWRRQVLDRCKSKLSHYSEENYDLPLLQQASVRKYLQFLQRHLVLVPMDKAANNIAFICKSLYVDTLRGELERNNGTYELVRRSKTEILVGQKKYLLALMGEPQLPYLYGMPKFHKPGWRFIAGSKTCSTASYSKILSDVLLKVMRSLREKDNAHILRTGIRRYFVVENYEEVAVFLGRWRRQLSDSDNKNGSLYTGDFSTMYTTIPHRALLAAISDCIKEAFEWEATQRDTDVENIGICWTKVTNGSTGDVQCSYTKRTNVNRSPSTNRTDSKNVSFTKAQLVTGVRFLINNTYVVNGHSIRKQVIGIPMGTNCAPVLANLFLYAYESRYIDRLMMEDKKAAALFHMSFRYIDDTLSVDNPLWLAAVSQSSDEGGIYPSELQLNDTTPADGDAVHFLGMDIIGVGNRIRTSIFDKRNEFSFPVRRYPHMASLIPSTIPYGVFLGQLHRGYRTCSDTTDFLNFACEVGKRLVANGCRTSRLLQLFTSFIKRFVSKYHSVRKSTLVRSFRLGFLAT